MNEETQDEDLLFRALDAGLDEKEELALAERLKVDPSLAVRFMRLTRDEALLAEEVSQARACEKIELAARRRSRRWRARTEGTRARPVAFMVSAAGILLGFVLLYSLISTAPSSAPERKDIREARQEARDDTTPGREEAKKAEGEKTEPGQKRPETEPPLRERTVPAQEQPAQVAAAPEKRREEPEAPKNDPERIVRKTEGPAPAEPVQEQKPSPPQAPTKDTQLFIARVEETTGEAFLVSEGGRSPLTAGANLLPAQGLETGSGAGRLALLFPDKTRVELGPNTSVSEIKTEKGKRLFVVKGIVRAVVTRQPKDQPMIFATPHGEVKVAGTTLRLVLDPDPKRGTRVEVEEGRVELKNLAGKSVTVNAGRYAVASSGVELAARSPGDVIFSDTLASTVISPAWKLKPASDYWSTVKGALQAAGITDTNWHRQTCEITLPVGAKSWEVQMAVLAPPGLLGVQGILVESADGLNSVDIRVDWADNVFWLAIVNGAWQGVNPNLIGPIDRNRMHTYKIVLEDDSEFSVLVDGVVKVANIKAGAPSVWSGGIPRGVLFTTSESGQVLNTRFQNAVVR